MPLEEVSKVIKRVNLKTLAASRFQNSKIGENMSRKSVYLLLFMVLGAFIISPKHVQAQTPVVRAVLFFSPTCPHCHKVMNEDLPPLYEKYGDQLQILEIDITKTQGSQLYQLAITAYDIPQERLGVPALFVANTHLVGSDEIPAMFPSMIENGLQQGGIDWPPLPGITPLVETFEANLASGTSNASSLTMGERFALDPVGNTIAVIVLVGLVGTFILAAYAFMNRIKLNPWPEWVMPVLVVLGLIVAGYLTYIETTHTEAVCGPVGDCNTVQQSDYARLFGFLPVGVLGLLGYAAIGIAWFVKNKGVETMSKQSALAIWWMALFGTLFSIYLTFLEPFVIGASCAWCLTSAILMGLVLWTSTPIALQAMIRERKHRHVRPGRA